MQGPIRFRSSLKTAAMAAAVLLSAADPGIKKLGNAIIEYRDRDIHTVIAYEYSHRFHGEKWLMLDVALTTRERLSFDRKDFTLATPAGTRIPAASQQHFVADAQRIRLLRQNAGVWKRDLDSYFTDKPSAIFNLFALPGEGTVTEVLSTSSYGPALLTLYFESPDNHWREGQYRFEIDNGSARAALPLELK